MATPNYFEINAGHIPIHAELGVILHVGFNSLCQQIADLTDAISSPASEASEPEPFKPLDPICQCGYRFSKHQMDLRCPQATDSDIDLYYRWLKAEPSRMNTAPRAGDPRHPFFVRSEGFDD